MNIKIVASERIRNTIEGYNAMTDEQHFNTMLFGLIYGNSGTSKEQQQKMIENHPGYPMWKARREAIRNRKARDADQNVQSKLG